MSKVKLEVDDEFDTRKLKREVEKSNADVEQLEKIERKEDESLAEFEGDEEILGALTKKNLTNISVKDFIYDKEKYRWCCIKFDVPIKFKNIDMTNVLREAARGSTIWQVPKIKRAFTHKQNEELVVTTDGINIGVS